MAFIYVLLVAHLVGDFFLQDDWMAQNKSKSWKALSAHVVSYGVTLVCFMVPAVLTISKYAPQPSWLSLDQWVAVNVVAHFVTDAITSRINARFWFIDGVRPLKAFWTRATRSHREWIGEPVYEVAYNDKRHWFFVGIGVDQCIHFVTLFATAQLWLM